jgi:hypothetical protein
VSPVSRERKGKLVNVNTDKVIRWATSGVVVALGIVAGVASYRHILEVGWTYGETGWVSYLIPLTIDGLIVSSSLTLLNAALRGEKGLWLSWVALALGVVLTISANVLHGLQDSVIGAIYAALPAVTLSISFELLMGLIRRSARQAAAVEAAAAELELADVEAEPAAVEAPKEAPKRTTHVAPEHVAAAKAFLATVADVNKVNARHLAGIFPDMVARTRREILRKAKEEMGVGAPESAPAGTGNMLPGMTAITT